MEFGLFVMFYEQKYRTAMECLAKELEVLLTSADLAEH